MATSLQDLMDPQLVTAPGGAPNIGDAERQNALLQHLMNSLDKRQREALWGRIPGAPGSEQGDAIRDEVNANRSEAQQTQATLDAIRAGGGGGGYGIVKEPDLLRRFLGMADASAKERQAASVEQLRLARLPLQDLRKYVDDATPQQLSELMAGYKNLRGDVKSVLEKNLEKISETAGKASTLARDLLNEDVESMAKALDTSATEIQGHVNKANAALKGGVQEAQRMGAEAGKGAVGDIRAAVEEARKGVVPGAMAREGAMGAGYGSLAQQQARTLAASKREGMGLAEQLGAGRKAEINQRFDEMAEREGERLEQSLRARGLDNTTVAASQRQGMLAKVERGRSDALRQLNDQVAQQQLGQFNEWEKLRAMTGERVGLPGLGARERTGAAADRIAAQLESAGLGAGAQAALGTQRGEQDLGRLLAGKAGDFQMAGLQGLLQQEGAKTQAIAGGWRQKMALSAQLAQLGFTEQANALRQQADAEREIGGRSLTALQQGQQDMGRQLANVTQAQSGLEERVEHQGMNPALWLDLAKGIGVASQQGPPLGGLFGPGWGGPEFWGQFPGGQQEEEPEKKLGPRIENRIDIRIGDAVRGPDNEIYVRREDEDGNMSYVKPTPDSYDEEMARDTMEAIERGEATEEDTGTQTQQTQQGQQVRTGTDLGGDRFRVRYGNTYVILSGPDYRDWQVSGVVKPEHRPKPEDVQAVDASMADETPIDDPEEAAPGSSGQTGEAGQAGQVGQLGADAIASGTQLWDPNTNAPATSLTGITQPQITQQDLANYQQGLGRLPNHSTSGFQQLQNQFNQQQPQQNELPLMMQMQQLSQENNQIRPDLQTPAAAPAATLTDLSVPLDQMTPSQLAGTTTASPRLSPYQQAQKTKEERALREQNAHSRRMYG